MKAHDIIDDLSISTLDLDAFSELITSDEATQKIIFGELATTHSPSSHEKPIKHGTIKKMAESVFRNMIRALGICKEKKQDIPEIISHTPPKDFLSTITALKESIQKREDLEEESKRSFHTQIEPLCSWAEKDGLQAQFSMFKLGGKQAKIPVDIEAARTDFEKPNSQASEKQVVAHCESNEDIPPLEKTGGGAC